MEINPNKIHFEQTNLQREQNLREDLKVWEFINTLNVNDNRFKIVGINNEDKFKIEYSDRSSRTELNDILNREITETRGRITKLTTTEKTGTYLSPDGSFYSGPVGPGGLDEVKQQNTIKDYKVTYALLSIVKFSVSVSKGQITGITSNLYLFAKSKSL